VPEPLDPGATNRQTPDPPPSVLIRGGTVIDQGGERRADVLITEGRVTAVDRELAAPHGATLLDAGGCIVAPGLVDLHTHLREPGREESETIETGTRAAALGGYTAVVAMPNTEPTLDSAEAVRNVFELAAAATAEVAVAGAVTVGRAGERLAPMAELAALGVCLFTDDGAGVQSAGLMRRALEYSTGLGVTLAQHCEDETLAAGGSMHEGAWSSRLGLPGIPSLAEEVMVARDIALVRESGGRVHFLHLSTAASVELVRQAKAEGLAVTAEAAPHHFSLTDGCTRHYDPVFKVNPPLRPQSDVDAVKAGLADGTIDAIATDHAPHAPELKDLPFDQAPPGMLGLQTALSLALGELDLPVAQVLALMSWQPAAIARLDPGHGGDQGGPVVAGAVANLCVIDPTATWTVDPAALASRSHNSPYGGRSLTGQVRHTVFRGEPVVVDGKAQR
jgi:dihydroorotase